MAPIFVPSMGPESWRALLADPEKHWVPRYSARTLAHCWEAAHGFPVEISSVLTQEASLSGAQPLLIVPEWKVPLPGGSRASQNDVWVLARTREGLVSMAVEGKVNEPFDMTVGEWRSKSTAGRVARLAFLADVLALPSSIPDGIRYQLLHRSASAVLEAERFFANAAVMIVHSFSIDNLWFGDFAAFTKLLGVEAKINELVTTKARSGLPLHVAWVPGDRIFLEA